MQSHFCMEVKCEAVYSNGTETLQNTIQLSNSFTNFMITNKYSDNYCEFNLFFSNSTLVFSTNFPDQFLMASVLNKLHTDNTDDNNQDRQKSLGACIGMVNEGATNLVETRISLVRCNLFSCFSLKKRTSNPSNH